MKVNQTTMLFEDFTPDEGKEMLQVARALIMDGTIPFPLPNFIELWMTEFGYNEHQRLLVLATALPQRILLSIIEAKE